MEEEPARLVHKGKPEGLGGPSYFSDEPRERVRMDRNTAQILQLDQGFEQDTGISSPGWGGCQLCWKVMKKGAYGTKGREGTCPVLGGMWFTAKGISESGGSHPADHPAPRTGEK